ncbi:MAG: hypothetical protein OQL28_13255 [Sedimenticola sp.]|nr:hypothetical protein [Sedimenticola sp.]
MENHHQLIDQIYAAALDPSVWPLVMQSMERKFGGIACGIYTSSQSISRVSLTELRGIDPALLDIYIGHYLMRDNPWREVPALQRQGCVRTEASLDRYHGRPGYYHGTALYNEWMKPQDFIYTLGINLHVDEASQTKCFLYRPRPMGAFSDHDVARFRWISGHLANAVRVARRLSEQESAVENLLGVVDQMALGVLFLDREGKVIQANQYAQDLLDRRDGLVLRGTRLVASHRGDDGRLRGAIRCALAVQYGGNGPEAHLVSLRRSGSKQPLCAIAIPLSSRIAGPFLVEKAVAALIVNDPESGAVISTDWLQQRFQLTPAEARLAQDLSLGSNLRQAADKACITYETARWYMKCIFRKTGVERQAELIRLLLSEQMLLRQQRVH